MNILFAHFDTPIPKYLENNLIRCKNLFPSHSVILLTNVNYKFKKFNGINIVKYFPSKNWEMVKNNLNHSHEFRKNFWFLSLGRLIAISEFVIANNAEVLHIESDVLISKDFPFEAFSQGDPEILFPQVSESRSIASTLYLRNAKVANKLIDFIKISSTEDSYVTDMKVLSKLSKLQDVNFLVLPSIPSNSKLLQNNHKLDLKANEESIKYFKGLFDGADLGIYLFGDDPRNHRGKSKVRQVISDSFFVPQKIDFAFNFERKFLDIYDPMTNSSIPIYSLHIHVKSAKFFTESYVLSCLKSAVFESSKKAEEKLYFKVYLKSVLLSLIRRLKLFFKLIKSKSV
jgi:hypothetical protein